MTRPLRSVTRRDRGGLLRRDITVLQPLNHHAYLLMRRDKQTEDDSVQKAFTPAETLQYTLFNMYCADSVWVLFSPGRHCCHSRNRWANLIKSTRLFFGKIDSFLLNVTKEWQTCGYKARKHQKGERIKAGKDRRENDTKIVLSRESSCVITAGTVELGYWYEKLGCALACLCANEMISLRCWLIASLHVRNKNVYLTSCWSLNVFVYYC